MIHMDLLETASKQQGNEEILHCLVVLSRIYCPFAIFRYSIGSMPVLFLNNSANRLDVV